MTDGNVDCMVDIGNDGIADIREVNIFKKIGDREVDIRYEDRNLDGTFDVKRVKSSRNIGFHVLEHAYARYIKDYRGHWQQVGAISNEYGTDF